MIQEMLKRMIYLFAVGIAVLSIVDLQAGSCMSKQKNNQVTPIALTAEETVRINDIIQSLPNAKRDEDRTIDELMQVNTTMIGIIDHSEDQAYFKTLALLPVIRKTLENMHGNFQNMTEEEKKEWEPKIKPTFILSNQKLAEFINKMLLLQSGIKE